MYGAVFVCVCVMGGSLTEGWRLVVLALVCVVWVLGTGMSSSSMLKARERPPDGHEGEAPSSDCTCDTTRRRSEHHTRV